MLGLWLCLPLFIRRNDGPDVVRGGFDSATGGNILLEDFPSSVRDSVDGDSAMLVDNPFCGLTSCFMEDSSFILPARHFALAPSLALAFSFDFNFDCRNLRAWIRKRWAAAFFARF